MTAVSIRELKAKLSEIIRKVDESGESVEVTRNGSVVARIVPVKSPMSPGEAAEYWAEHKRLAETIGRLWIGEKDAVTAVREQRRNLTPDEWVTADWRPPE